MALCSAGLQSYVDGLFGIVFKVAFVLLCASSVSAQSTCFHLFITLFQAVGFPSAGLEINRSSKGGSRFGAKLEISKWTCASFTFPVRKYLE